MHDKQRQTIKDRIERNKTKVVEVLQKSPVIQIGCDRANISRATFFRWKNEDHDFAQAVEKALSYGNGFISDMAIAQLIKAIQQGNTALIKFWLSNHHIDYANKLNITAEIKREDIKLTPEQEEIVRRGLELASLPTLIKNKHEPRNTKNYRSNDQGQQSPQSDNNTKS